MKYPKEIHVKQIFFDNNSYYVFKYHHKEYEGCYCYIHWWQNTEGKWRCFKK